MKKVFSTVNEYFDYDDERECLRDKFSACDEKAVTIYSAESVECKLSDFLYLPGLIESIQDQAYEEVDELAEGYLDDITIDQQADLESMIKSTLDEWADKHRHQPRFYRVINVTERLVTRDEFEGK